jgi:hypothetical protein
MRPSLFTFAPLVFALGCAPVPGPSAGPVCALVATSSLTEEVAKQRVLAVGSNYNSGHAVFIRPDDLTSEPAPRALLDTLTGDSIARVMGSTLAVLNRSSTMGDNVTFFDLRGGAPRYSCQLGLVTTDELAASGRRPYANAHDVIAIDPHRLYVARWNLPSLAVIDLTRNGVTATLDLSRFRGTAPLPYPESFARVNGEVWVTLQRLDDLRAPTQPGLIVRIDPTTGTVRDTIPLPHANPVGTMQRRPRADELWVSTVGSFTVEGDGGLVRIGTDGTVLGVALDERAVGGNIDSFAFLDADRVVVRVTGLLDAMNNVRETRFVMFNVRTRESSTWYTSATWSPAPPLVLNGKVFLGDPGNGIERQGAGVRVLGLTGERLRASNITTGPGMWPYDLAVVP